MRNTTQRAIVILVLCVASGLLLNVVPTHAAETLMVTRDHFEFRDSPKVDEDTLIGTLWAGTQVEWTGTMSGDWYEVRGPGNQVGWIHKSGVSAPKTAPTSQQPATTSAGTSSSRTVTTRASSTSALQKQVTELEKDNALYKALLDEKELRATELSGEIEELEQKLLDTAQEMSDSQQMREMQQTQVVELEKRLDELNATLEERESELRKTNIELTKLQTQINRARPTDRLFLYGIYGVLGLLVFMLLSVVFWFVRRNASAKKMSSPTPDRRSEHIHPGTSERPGSIQEVVETDLPVPPPASASQSSSTNEYIDDDDLEEIEDVEIELSDVLPATDLDDSSAPDEEIEEIGDVDIVSENDLDIIEDLDTIDEVAENIEDVDVLEEIEAIEDADVVDEIAPVEEVDVLEAIDEIEAIEEVEEIEAIDDIEVLDAPDYHSDAVENAFLHAPEAVSIYEELEEREEHLDIFDGEEAGGDSDFDFDSIYDYEADTLGGTEDVLAEIEEPASEQVDVGGETYEMLVEQSTQIIESDDDLEDEVLIAPKAFEDVSDLESEYLPTLKEEIEDLSDLLEAREMELEEIHNYGGDDDEHAEEEVVDEELDYLMADLDDEHVQDMAIDDIEVIEEVDELDDFDEIEMIEEVDDGVFEAEGESEFESVTTEHPDLLEPSPVLIEPEYEPAEAMLSDAAKNNAAATASEENADTPPIYEIELMDVGNNPEQIVEFLSKVKGLPKPPNELVRTVPTIITKDAKETDAKNFQILMQKLGATIRVVKH